MDSTTAERLITLNRTFYERLASPFARTRARPQPGFLRVLAYLPERVTRVLDVGCGEGRFGRFLVEHIPLELYTGVDFSPGLLEEARNTFPPGDVVSEFYARDLSQPAQALEGLGRFDVVACLAVLQHLPGRSNRADLLRELGKHLRPGGRLIISTWQFMESERQRRKLASWEAADISPEAVEENDYLLTWQSGGFGLRYVAFIDALEVQRLAEEAGLTVFNQFRSDGREGDLNLYSVLGRKG